MGLEKVARPEREGIPEENLRRLFVGTIAGVLGSQGLGMIAPSEAKYDTNALKKWEITAPRGTGIGNGV